MLNTTRINAAQFAVWLQAALKQADPQHGNDLQGSLRLLEEVEQVVARGSREEINICLLKAVVRFWHRTPSSRIFLMLARRRAQRHGYPEIARQADKWLAYELQSQRHLDLAA